MKQKLPTKEEILRYWLPIFNNDNGFNSFFIDPNEPTCWACGESWGGRYDIKNEKDNIYKHWNKAPLERCHIIAESLGGKAVPSNLFLMCKECHILSPDTTSKDIFFTWVKKQNHVDRKTSAIKRAFSDFGINIDDPEIANKLLKVFENKNDRKDLFDFLDKNTAKHFGVRPITTFVGGLKLFSDNNDKMKQEKGEKE